MQPKRHPEINLFLALFLEASGNSDGSVGGASGKRRGSRDRHTFSSGSPRAAPYYQRILYISDKQRRDSLQDLTRLGLLAWRISLFRFSRRTRVSDNLRFGRHRMAAFLPFPLSYIGGRASERGWLAVPPTSRFRSLSMGSSCASVYEYFGAPTPKLF